MQIRSKNHAANIYPWYVLAVLFIVYVCNFTDRQIISILAQDIKASLGVSDTQLGFLYGTTFAIIYTVFGIPIARLADRWHRVRIIGLGLATWSTMSALSGLASSYGQLMLARVGVAIGEASATPAAYSLLSDYFPSRRRALAIGIYYTGLSVGAGLSLSLGGWISHAWSSSFPAGAAPFGLAGWQAAFLAVGLPGLFLALWVLNLREPVRGSSDGLHLPAATEGIWRTFAQELAAILPPLTFVSVARFPRALSRNLLLFVVLTLAVSGLAWLSGDWAQWIACGLGTYAVGSWLQMLRATDRPTFVLLLGTRPAVLTLLGLGGLAFMAYSLAFWIPPYVMRTFGVRADTVGIGLGVPGMLAASFGAVAGGYLSDRWKGHDMRGRLFVCMLSVALTVPTTVAILIAGSDRSIYVLYPILQLVTFLPAGSGAAAVQECVLPRMRATAGAILLLAYCAGLALGPYATARLSSLTGSLRIGMLGVLAMAPIALCMFGLAARDIGLDEATRLERARAAGEFC